jgi:Phosphoesterase family
MEQVFDRIFIMIFENKSEQAVLDNAFMKGLAAQGVRLTKYFGVAHPSQPNYIAAAAGLPLITDDSKHDIDSTNIVDLLEAKGVSWRAYMEDLPEKKKAIHISANRLYFRKHNPFVSFNNVRNNPERLANIVNARHLKEDIKNNALPQYCWFTPNIQNDGHSPPDDFQPTNPLRHVNFIAQYLKDLLLPLLADPKFMKGTLVVVMFDESIPHADNHVYAVLLGDMLKANTVQSEIYNHYSLLRTIEENFGLGTLGRNDLTANFFGFLWGLEPPTFDWKEHSQ